MKKSFVIKISIIIVLILAIIIVHDIILSIEIERRDNNQETDIVKKEENEGTDIVENEASNNEEISNIENPEVKEISSWVKCQEALTCYLDEGEYKVGDVKYGTPVVKTPDGIPFPYPTEEEVLNQNTLIRNLDLKVVITNDNRFVIKGNNLNEEIQLMYDTREDNVITSTTLDLLNYQDKKKYSKYDMDIDVFFKGRIVYNSKNYMIEVMELDGEPYIAIRDGELSYISPLIKL